MHSPKVMQMQAKHEAIKTELQQLYDGNALQYTFHKGVLFPPPGMWYSEQLRQEEAILFLLRTCWRHSRQPVQSIWRGWPLCSRRRRHWLRSSLRPMACFCPSGNTFSYCLYTLVGLYWINKGR